MGDVTPPPLQGPTSKERKYDRQLRLWAASGQLALEEANILLINSGSGVVGVEALKNLVLPGTGRFTILDSSLVVEADLGVNFFLEDTDVGKFRAESCCRWLQELNPDVTGSAITEPLETFITKADALRPYSLILTILPGSLPELQDILSEHSQKTGVPTFYIHCLGFYAHFTLQLPPTFPIVDTHPDSTTTTDLRLLKPWPELSELVIQQTSNLEQMDDDQHGHVPYAVLLLHYLQQWKENHEGSVPGNYKEKSEFRELVRAGARTHNAEGAEENYDEAVGAVLKSLNEPTISSAVREVFEADECQNLTKDSADFWLIAHALDEFYGKNRALPLPGTLPDMKAKSADYIKLQNVYKGKARADLAEVTQTVRSLEQKLQRTVPVASREIEAFCKNAGYVKLVRGRVPRVSHPGNIVKWKDRAKFAYNALTDSSSLILLYIAFLAFDSFTYSHLDPLQVTAAPGGNTQPDSESKINGIAQTLIDSLIKEASNSGFRADPEYTNIKDEIAKIVAEMVRAGGAELHNIAAATGGMVAQEVIKVITKQYVPVDNTCLFDGITSKTSVLKL